MISVAEFRQLLSDDSVDNIVDEVILSGEALHVSSNMLDNIRNEIGAKFGTPVQNILIKAVGSAKLGFSIHEKRTEEGAILPRYREFGSESDIDIAIHCPRIFQRLWDDLSTYANRSNRLPWDASALSHPLISPEQIHG